MTSTTLRPSDWESFASTCSYPALSHLLQTPEMKKWKVTPGKAAVQFKELKQVTSEELLAT